MSPKNLLSVLPELYLTAYTRDHTALFAGRRTEFSVVRAGTLYLASGQIVLCDPLIGNQREPYVQRVLPGHYPVDFSLGYDSVARVERILFSRILFSKNEPVIWVQALREGEEDRQGAGVPAITTSSGAFALMDHEAAKSFKLESMIELDQLLDRLVANFRPHRSWVNHLVDGERNGIFLATGASDRPISSFFAIDYEGDICFLLTSFYL